MSFPTEASNEEQLSRLGCHEHLEWANHYPYTWVMLRLDQDTIDDTTPQTVIGKEEVPIDLSFLEEEEKEEILGKDQAGVQPDLDSPETRLHGPSNPDGPITWDGSALNQAQSTSPPNTRQTISQPKNQSSLRPTARAYFPTVQRSEHDRFPSHHANAQISQGTPEENVYSQYDRGSFPTGNGVWNQYVFPLVWQPNTGSASGVWKASSTEHDTAHPSP